jgi:hypothetical protein
LPCTMRASVMKSHCGKKPKARPEIKAHALGSVLNGWTTFKKLLTTTNVHWTMLITTVNGKTAELENVFYFGRINPKQELTSRNILKWVKFARQFWHHRWDKIMVTDHELFLSLYPGNSVPQNWCINDLMRELWRPPDPSCFYINVGILPHGVSVCHAVIGTTNRGGLK